MLMLGSTMAWFEDHQVVINTYTFGNLKVDIVDAGCERIGDRNFRFVKPDDEFYDENEFLFEPGARFCLEAFRIHNAGSVDLQYRLQLASSYADDQLLSAMDIYATIGGEPFDMKNDTGFLAAGQYSEEVKIFIHMREDAGNEYQDKAASNLFVKVIAVQGDGIPDEKLDKVFEDTANRSVPG